MNISQTETETIQLMSQYSINGELTTATSNADYLLKTRNLIDACVKYLANLFPIIKVLEIIQVPANNPTDFVTYALPIKFDHMISVHLKKYPRYETIPYLIQGSNVLISPSYDGTIILTYKKIPDDIIQTTAATTELELIAVCQKAIPYYVAGWTYIEDNPTIGTMLLNEFQNKVNAIKQFLPVTPTQIENIYSSFL